jgi:hypothetical protein
MPKRYYTVLRCQFLRNIVTPTVVDVALKCDQPDKLNGKDRLEK